MILGYRGVSLAVVLLLAAAAGTGAAVRADRWARGWLPLAARATPEPSPVPLPTGWTQATVPITVGGLARSYLLIRPATTGPTPLPVLIDLQGCCTTPEVEAGRSGFLAVTGPAILVFPTGYEQSWNAGFCCRDAQADQIDDVAFLDAVVAQLRSSQPDADPARVYLTGYSNGGRMALRMACAAPGLFTAIAAYGAVSAAPCPDPPAVSLLEVAGTADTDLTLGPGGTPKVVDGFTEPTVYQQVQAYRDAGACATGPRTVTAGKVTSTVWAGCRSGGTVQLSLYRGGDHSWPQADGATPSAAQLMWAFFQTVAATRR